MDIFFQILIKQYIIKPECLVLFSDANQHPFNIPLDTLLYNFKISSNNNNLQFNHNSSGCRNFALNMINSQETFNYLEKYLHQSVNATFENRKYFIFVNSLSECKKIFSSPAAKFVSNLIVAVIRKTQTFSINLAKNEDILIEIFTHKFVGLHNNNNQEIISIDKWFSTNKTFLYGKNLFYNKINDLNGRIIKVGTFEHSPYTTFSKKKNKWTGIDINLLRTVIKYINGTMKIKTIKDYWGFDYANGTKTGSKGDLYLDIIDVATGGFYLGKEVLQFYCPTYPFTSTEITCLVPLPKFGTQGLFPFYAFSRSTWISLSIGYIIIGFTIYLFQYISIYNKPPNNTKGIIKRRLKRKMFKNSFALVGRMLLQQNVRRKEYNLKFLISTIMMFTMVITISYNAGFTAVMTKPNYDNPINTLEDFLNSNILWGTVQKAHWIEAWRNHTNEKYRNAEKRYVDSNPDELRKLSKKGNFAFYMEKVAGRRYCVDNYIKVDVLQNYYVMEGILQTKYISVLLRKNSVFYPIFQKISGILSQAGLFAYWANEFTNNGDYILQNSIRPLHYKRDFTPVILTLPRLFGAFYALIIGDLMAIVIFIFELLYRR